MSRAVQSTLPHLIPAEYARQLILGYIADNREKYLAAAQVITPDLSNATAIWSRLVCAILSANAPFDDSVRALGYALEHRMTGLVWKGGLDRFAGMVPAKVVYVNALPTDLTIREYLKGSAESWDAYRMRLKGIAGLGLAKASFAACLLYPLEADLACIDTHIQKVYLGFDRFRSLNHATYCAVEEQIRELAQRVGISTFLAQWLIWDFSRGTVSSHDIFPGGHKR